MLIDSDHNNVINQIISYNWYILQITNAGQPVPLTWSTILPSALPKPLPLTPPSMMSYASLPPQFLSQLEWTEQCCWVFLTLEVSRQLDSHDCLWNIRAISLSVAALVNIQTTILYSSYMTGLFTVRILCVTLCLGYISLSLAHNIQKNWLSLLKGITRMWDTPLLNSSVLLSSDFRWTIFLLELNNHFANLKLHGLHSTCLDHLVELHLSIDFRNKEILEYNGVHWEPDRYTEI